MRKNIGRRESFKNEKKCTLERNMLLFLYFIGLERTLVSSDSLFLNIGERCNVAGSRRFARLIREGQYEVCSMYRTSIEFYLRNRKHFPCCYAVIK
jgi:5-methyltetrahydrofolate--homocysteine methyltransferase